MAVPNIAEAHNQKQVLMVYLGEQIFGVPIELIQDVLGPQQITYVPLAPAAIRGVLNLRGRIVTAIDLRSAVGGEALADRNAHYMSVVVEIDGELYSLIVDKVGDVIQIETANIEEAPLTMKAAWRQVCGGVYQLQQKIMILLNTPAILDIAYN